MVRLLITSWLCCSLLAAQETASPPEEDRAANALQLVSLVPLNAPIRDFRLPQYKSIARPAGEQASVLTSVITAKEIRRVSDTSFVLDDLKILLYEEGSLSGEMVTRRASYNLTTRMLSGHDKVTVTHPDMTTEGIGFIYYSDRNGTIWSLLREVTTKFRFEKPDKP